MGVDFTMFLILITETDNNKLSEVFIGGNIKITLHLDSVAFQI